MKKTYISCANCGTEVASYRNDGSEAYALYVGIDAVYGGWIMETGGDPTCLNELEEAVSNGINTAEAEINAINEIIANPSTSWESLNFEDQEYIRFTLKSWGL